jgi:hypothetical protein
VSRSKVEQKRVTRSEGRAGISLRTGRRFLVTVVEEEAAPADSGAATPFVHLLLVDAQGAIKAGAQVRVLHGGAVVATGRSGSDGVLRIDGLPQADGYEIEVVGHRSEKKA